MMKTRFIRAEGFNTPPFGAWLLIILLIFLSTAFPAFAETSLGFAGAARLAVEASAELRNEYTAKALKEGAWLWGMRAYFPRFGITASEDDRVSEIGSDSFRKNYSVNVEQLLWDGGRLSLSRKMERADLDLAGNRLKQIAGDIADAAVSAYRDVLKGRKVLEIREKALESINEQRRILEREFEHGLVRALDLNEAEIAAAMAELEVDALSMELKDIEWRLTEMLGLETLPFLSERIDTLRSPKLPSPAAACSLAESRNHEIAAFRYSVARRQAELKAASLSWIPSLRITGSFGLSGRQYPLSRFSWSVGINVDFSSAWISGNTGFSAGQDPPYERNARIQQTLTPASDPAAVFSVRQAELALAYERSRYETALAEIHSAVEREIKNCSVLDKKRLLALEAMELEKQKYRLEELKLSLGEIRRVDLIEALLEYTKREAELVEAAAAVSRAERKLERLLDLKPGELSAFAERNVL